MVIFRRVLDEFYNFGYDFDFEIVGSKFVFKNSKLKAISPKLCEVENGARNG